MSDFDFHDTFIYYLNALILRLWWKTFKRFSFCPLYGLVKWESSHTDIPRRTHFKQPNWPQSYGYGMWVRAIILHTNYSLEVTEGETGWLWNQISSAALIPLQSHGLPNYSALALLHYPCPTNTYGPTCTFLFLFSHSNEWSKSLEEGKENIQSGRICSNYINT